ncbi:MAG: hypothetical protein BAJALOKI3v1_1240001 [Promethearchaeota archaeon]|nr:MAG: hypothetical protein BAJALOKI3v1_1240001 [Candidatus Lokiarchaeota archaeon]
MIMENIKFKTLCSIVFILSTFISLSGQERKLTINGFYINPKLGIYNWVEDDAGFIGGVEMNVLKDKFLYSADFYRYEELVIFSPTPAEYYNQIGIMMGKFVGDKLFRFQYQGGIAPIWGIKRTKLVKEGSGILATDYYENKDFFTIGLVTKLGFKIIPTRFLSIGIDLQANINLENPVYMPMISIEIGKLRNKINEP